MTQFHSSRHSGRALRAALFGSTLLAVAAAPLAQAQDAAETDDTIVVVAPDYVPEGGDTANKSDIPLIETPQSISVITRDQMDLLNFIDAQQAVRYTSGVFGENYGPDLRFDFLTVRGFTPKQYIDGLAAPVSTSILSVGLDLYAFETMDVLKGPASALYGVSPPGGLYNQRARRPESDFGGEMSIQYGSDDYKQVAGTVTGAVADNLSARFTGLYRDRDAERDHVSAERVLLAPSATWNITPDTDLTGLFYYQKDVVLGDTNGFLPVYGTLLDNPLGKVDPSVNLGDPENRFEREQSGIGYEFSHAFNDNVSFISNAKFSNYEESTPTGIYGGGGLVDDDFDGTPDDYRTVQQYNFSYKEEVEGFATDNRFDVSLVQGALSHDIIGGVDYRTVDNKAAYGFIFANRIDLFEPVYMPQATLEPGYPFAFNDQELTQTGVYVQDHIGYDKFFVTVSARQDWVEIDSELTGNKTKQDKFTYRVGGNYIFDNGIAPYISYATSFEPVLGVDAVTNEDFKPSEGEQFEIGVKYDARGLPDGIDLLMSGAIYQITQKNVVSTAPSVTPVSGTQSGEVEVNGVELELVSRINDQLSINASYSYTDSEVVESGTAVEIGSPLPVTPKNKASVFVDYTVNAGSLAGLGFGAGVRYTDESNGALPGPFAPVVYTGEESTLVDAIIRYDINKWRFAINGSNLLDEEYVARCASASGCTYGAGRQLIATVKKSF